MSSPLGDHPSECRSACIGEFDVFVDVNTRGVVEAARLALMSERPIPWRRASDATNTRSMKSRAEEVSALHDRKAQYASVAVVHDALTSLDGVSEQARAFLVAGTCDRVYGENGGFILVNGRTRERAIGRHANTMPDR